MNDLPRLTESDVRARRLSRHALTAPSKTARPADIAAAMASTHAQVMSAAELAVAMRIDGATRLDVREALWSERSLVKTYGLRGTVHFMAARDLSLWVGALSALPAAPNTQPPGVRLTTDQTEEVVAAVAAALDDAELTIDELTEAVVERAGSWAGDLVMEAFQGKWPRWRQAMALAGMRGVLCFAPNRGRKVAYTNPRRWLPGFEPADARTALPWLVTSYLYAYGPSTPRRFAHWLGVPATWAKDLFGSMGEALQEVEVEGESAWIAAGDLDVPADPPQGVRLLPYFDGYAYRVGNQPPASLYPGRAAERVLPGNYQILLVDGVVAGLWHQHRSGRKISITVEPLGELTAAQLRDLDDQVDRVGQISEGTPRLTIGPVPVGGHA
ncbi:AlkZ family DNA glycosylase [Microbispora sp. NEAU-D428]|uniref:winged helix DNA-binding domain-containing protein n=1 Tax=Microbispora sitophila TaxID=2771537 RepID=UPI001866FF81|nr:winged helix DNA-binding domain-containing protein [Microbispora sitophila]MBE3013603.1 AlkZ family DNA glycosylase [Microbispora sitophila]